MPITLSWTARLPRMPPGLSPCCRRARGRDRGRHHAHPHAPLPGRRGPDPDGHDLRRHGDRGHGRSVNGVFTIQVAPPPARCAARSRSAGRRRPGSASAPGDFTASSGTVSLTKARPPGSSPCPSPATPRRADETFFVNLTAPTRPVADAQGVATITDDDAADGVGDRRDGRRGTPAPTPRSPSPCRRPAGTAVTVTERRPTARPPRADYTPNAQPHVRAGCHERQTFTVNGDVLDEADETFMRRPVEPRERDHRRRPGARHDHRRRPRPDAVDRRRDRHGGERRHATADVHRHAVGRQRRSRSRSTGRDGRGHRRPPGRLLAAHRRRSRSPRATTRRRSASP